MFPSIATQAKTYFLTREHEFDHELGNQAESALWPLPYPPLAVTSFYVLKVHHPKLYGREAVTPAWL